MKQEQKIRTYKKPSGWEISIYESESLVALAATSNAIIGSIYGTKYALLLLLGSCR
jgi:hypothetical protein